MKKHLWLVAVSLVCLVGAAYAWKTRQIFQPTQTISVTGSVGTAITARTDTISLLSDMGQFSRAAFSVKVQIPDSGSQQSVAVDTCRWIFAAVGNGVYAHLDTLIITPLIADSAVTRVKVVEWSDSLGIGRLKGNQLVVFRRISDTSNVGASLGSDSAFNYNISYSLYCQE